MYLYLPIAEISMNIFLIIGLGGAVGMLSGIFGVGGGFLMTPLLIFLGVPPAVAVGTEANQIVASSVSGVMAHMRRGNVDFKMGGVLLAGGLTGSTIGVALFALLRELGQIDVVIKLSFIVFLGIIGSLMLIESIRAIMRSRQPGARRGKLHQHNWLHGLPFKMRFRKSKLYISALLPFGGGARGCAFCHHGCWWRLYHGACHDLPVGHANRCGGGNIFVPDHFCDRERDFLAVRSDTDGGYRTGWLAAIWCGDRSAIRDTSWGDAER